MAPEVGWSFPPTNGGKEDGWNDPGIATFTGAPLSSLARETIQNSLDARKSEASPVEVVFELIAVNPDEIGAGELRGAVASSILAANEQEDVRASQALSKAQDILVRKGTPCLRVYDRNTIGLPEKNWHALVKMQGLSQKEGAGAGGSFGIGKYAPFAVSALRTVFYWTCYHDQNQREVEKFQGKAVLMSHGDAANRTQGTGFYGITEACEALTDSIPRSFRLQDKDGNRVHGTALLVAGFSEERNWRNRIASSVIENYFYAIDKGNLKVMVEPDSNAENLSDIEIESGTLHRWFESLQDNASVEDEEDGTALKRAKAYWELADGSIDAIEKQDHDLGHCNLFIRVGEGLPSRVALVRRTGMLVTDQQPNLMRFPLHQGFAAMCVFEDTQGNELLRRMENPRHDKFEPDHLPEDEREKGRRALARITKWIRDEIRKQAGPRETGQTTALSELAAYLPDLYPDEPFDDAANDGGEGTKERGFGDRITVKLKPIRRVAPPLPRGEEDDAEGYGDDGGGSGGGAGGANGGAAGTGGPGDGEGEGGAGGQSGGAVRKLLPISAVRVLPVPGAPNRYRLSFKAHRTGTARIELEEAGDSNTNPLEGVRAADGSTLAEIALTAGKRTPSLEIIADNPIHDRALRVAAVEVVTNAN